MEYNTLTYISRHQAICRGYYLIENTQNSLARPLGTDIHTHTHTYTHSHTSTHTYSHTHSNTHTYTYTDTYTFTYTFKYAYLHLHLHIHIHIHLHIQIHMRINENSKINSLPLVDNPFVGKGLYQNWLSEYIFPFATSTSVYACVRCCVGAGLSFCSITLGST